MNRAWMRAVALGITFAVASISAPVASAHLTHGYGRHHPKPAHGAAVSVEPSLSFLHVGGAAGPGGLAQILDSADREVLLRGVNVNGLRDDYVSNNSLTVPYPETATAYANGACPAINTGVYFAPVCAKDAGQLASYGYNVVRLTVSWSQLEPQPGQLSVAYFDRIAQVVDWLAARGIYTVIDLHDDGWSKYVYTPSTTTCPPGTDPITGFHEADGAPAWASTHATPACAAGGVRDLDLAVQEDFQDFYDDAKASDGVGLQEHYANVLVALAQRFAGDPAVAGYDLLNEPEPGPAGPGTMETTELFPLYAKLIKAVTARVPGFRQLFFIEPDVTRDLTDRSVTLSAWSLFSSYPNVVYSPHIYTGVFTLNAESGTSALNQEFPADGGYDTSVQDSKTLGLPLWVGEFGNSITQDSTLLNTQYDNEDRLGVGGALWYWKGQPANDGRWSVLFDSPTQTDGVYPSRVLYTDRAYPLATAGTLNALSYSPSARTFSMSAAASRYVATGAVAGSTVIHLPALIASLPLTVYGARFKLVPQSNGSATLLLSPNGDGIYGVSVAPPRA